MLLSRWKLMAGVLGVSLGGLAAVAGQCPKSDTKTTTRRHAEPPEAEVPLLPAIPSGGTPTAKPLELPSAPALPAAPAVTLPAPAAAAELPPLPGAPAAPSTAPEPASTKEPVKTEPALPAPPVVPVRGTEPKPVSSKPEPVSKPTLPAPAPAAPELPDVKAAPVPVTKPAPAGTTPDFPVTTFVPPAAKPADPVIEPKPEVKPASATVAVPAGAAVAASKYRILLRVGEGEPTFEVKCGDDLVLKVVCEKIDIKSPEKGTGPSAVQARGKVRFVGFGAEGTCEDLAFLAGTGEVTLAGAVKIQVKDKLGRIESELSTETMKYKIDPSAVLTGGKP